MTFSEGHIQLSCLLPEDALWWSSSAVLRVGDISRSACRESTVCHRLGSPIGSATDSAHNLEANHALAGMNLMAWHAAVEKAQSHVVLGSGHGNTATAKHVRGSDQRPLCTSVPVQAAKGN